MDDSKNKKSNQDILTIDELIDKASSLLGLQMNQINENLEFDGKKGDFGFAIEEGGFNYPRNSRAEADFKDLNVELKVTPFKRNANGTYSSKERLVLNIINYMEEYKKSFEDSSLWTKNQTLLILFYEYIENVSKSDFMIKYGILHQFSEQDLIIIKNDWQIIIDKIKAGKAHEISEADTYYLGACTKGKNSSSTRQQPFSNIPAKQRAFSLKTTYMTQIVRELTSNTRSEDSLFNYVELVGDSFEESIIKKVAPYIGMTESQLLGLFELDTVAKSRFEMIFTRMLGLKGKLSKVSEFIKANIQVKTIRVEETGKVKESMSFPAFKFTDIVNQEWEDSDIYKLFETKKFMFVVFKKVNGEYIFDNVVFWNMPHDDLNKQLKKVWTKTKEVVLSGHIVSHIHKNGRRFTNFPGQSLNPVGHVRPHATLISDTYPLPVKDCLTGLETYMKQCFWLNSKYVKESILGI
ncbi:MAG: Sau3AI family type II restriction endonuclease [Acholeplasma sp.]|nr:Sau3AI family type II restriction endonuclease [Acholeplasma sp.]